MGVKFAVVPGTEVTVISTSLNKKSYKRIGCAPFCSVQRGTTDEICIPSSLFYILLLLPCTFISLYVPGWTISNVLPSKSTVHFIKYLHPLLSQYFQSIKPKNEKSFINNLLFA
jgi:hypothetical protein